MATTKIGVEIDLDPSGVQRGAAAATKAVEGLGDSGKGLNKLDNAFKGLAEQSLQLPGPLGRVADALLDMAPGGIAGAAFLAGIGASIMILKSYADAAERTEKLNKDLAQSIADIEGRGKEFKLAQLNEELRTLQKESESAWRAFWLGSDGRFFGFGDSNQDKLIKNATEQIRAAGAIANEVNASIQSAAAAARDVQLAQAEAGGTGLQERLRQARELETQAENNYRNLLRAGTATETQLNEARAASSTAQAGRIRAETALRDAAHQRRLKQEEEARKFQQTLAREREEQEKRYQSVIERGLRLLEQQGRERTIMREQISAMVTSELEKDLQRMSAQLDADMAKMEQAAVRAAQIGAERANALEPLITGIASGLDVMTKALVQGENAFKSFGQGARAAITDILRALARQNIVEGLGALGKGFAAAANPLTAFAAGSFFKSAAQHFAAAAAAGVGAAAIGAGGGGSSGAGRGVGPGGSFGFNQSQLGGLQGEQGTLFITIQGGGILDMNNPETARAFANALQTATNRRIVFGGA